jgi:hypothetical protein
MSCGHEKGNGRSGRSDQACPDCQNAQRRATKRFKNRRTKGIGKGVGHYMRRGPDQVVRGDGAQWYKRDPKTGDFQQTRLGAERP